ncbi:hypothetical protein F442_06013 [Phytophthora nicotianae P10297]|uniref:Uncharacterized protein n=1 Tax=Phytophthora nicotianae P10297 TaxID=1317064 RepID=W2ZLS1_PHYNI|nr:hypothetical protein F442_06013 [Phytophthora nicotianae P10297]
MRKVEFGTLQDAASEVVSEYKCQYQPRVDGFIIPDTYEASLYQGHFNFSGPYVISHEQHEANSQAYSGVDDVDDIPTELRIFFPSITDDVIVNCWSFIQKTTTLVLVYEPRATNALKNTTWNAECALGSATHGADQSYYWYSTYTLSTSSSISRRAQATDLASSYYANVSAASAGIGSALEGSFGGMAGAGGAGGESSVSSTIAIMMQKYLMSFVITGNPNTMWPDDKLYWPQYNESSVGTEIVFNDTFTVADDDLANSKSLFWNKALWY